MDKPPFDLTWNDLAAFRNQGRRGVGTGSRRRFYCPVHGSDKQRSLTVDMDLGKYKCFSCQAWGTVKEQGAARIAASTLRRQVEPDSEVFNIPDNIDTQLAEFQKALPGSPGAAYLKKRGIPLEVAQRYGAGYAACGKWPGSDYFQWQEGRIVFPHTLPDGVLVNLYGRAVVVEGEEAPKKKRHAHLPGNKAFFNGEILRTEKNTLYICEAPFDALALITAGYTSAAAIYGLEGLYRPGRWRWIAAKKVVLALDSDEEAQKVIPRIAKQGLLSGKRLFTPSAASYAGRKDFNAVLVETGAVEIDIS